MGDPQNQNQGNKANKGRKGSLEEFPEGTRNPEKPREQGERRRREALMREKQQERGGVALDILDEKSKARLIRNLDLDKTPEEQNDVAALYNFSLQYEVLPLLLAAGLEKKYLANIKANPGEFQRASNVLRSKFPDKFKKWDETAQAAFEKIVEVFSNSGRKFEIEWRSEWDVLAQNFASQYGEAVALRDTPPSLWSKTKAISKDTLGWIKNHKVESALIVGGVLTAGWLFNKLWGKKKAGAATNQAAAEAPQKEGFIGKWGKRLLLGGLGVGTLFILGKIIPWDKAKDFITGLWEDSWLGKKIGKGKEKAAEEKKRNEFYEKIAAQIGIENPDMLEVFGEYNYKDFMSFQGEMLGAAEGKVKQFFADSIWGNLSDANFALLPDPVKKFIENKKKEPHRIAEAEGNLRKFLVQHRDKIEKIYPNGNIKQVLDGLAREGIFGQEFMGKTLVLTPEQVPSPVQSDIQKNYPTLQENNNVRQLSLRVFEKQHQQYENTFGSKGLIARLEHMAQKDPSYRKKIVHVKELHAKLEEKRGVFSKAIKDTAAVSALEALIPNISEASEDFDDTCAEYYAEIAPHMPAWAPIPYFIYRYARLSPRKRTAVREQLRKIAAAPLDAARAFQEGRNPVEFTQQSLAKAQQQLSEFERKKGFGPESRESIRKTPGPELEWRNNIMKVEYLNKKLAFEKARVAFNQLSEAQRAAKAAELLRLEKEYLLAYQGSFGSSIEWAKKLLPEASADMSEMEKIEFVQNIKTEKRRLRSAIQDFRKGVLAEAKRVGKEAPSTLVLIRELDEMTDLYRKTVRTELSFWNFVIGRDKGLRKQFVEWLKEEKMSNLVKFVKEGTGVGKNVRRIGVMSLILVPGLIGEYRDIKEKNPDIEFGELMKDLGLSGGQILADVCPFTFGASDWYTVWTGEEVITRKQTRGWDRYSRIIWGTFGALLDTASLVPAVDLVGVPANAIMRVARGAGRMAEGEKIIAMWPRIKSVAEHLGGWKKFAARLKAFRESPARAAKLGHAAEMTKIAVPRLAATVMIGSIAVPALYTMGDDVNKPGEEMDPEVIQDIESHLEEAPQAHGGSIAAPEAPTEGGNQGEHA